MKLQVHTIEFRHRVRLPTRSHEQLITPGQGIDVEVDLDRRLVRLSGVGRDDAPWRTYVPFENVSSFETAELEPPDDAQARKGRARHAG